METLWYLWVGDTVSDFPSVVPWQLPAPATSHKASCTMCCWLNNKSQQTFEMSMWKLLSVWRNMPESELVPSSPCGTPAVLQEGRLLLTGTSQCAAVWGMAQPLSAQKHHLLPRLAETWHTAASPGRASLGVAPDCHVLIRKPWGSLC